jgi:RNA polymerase sigma factor (TIGR02999 family)
MADPPRLGDVTRLLDRARAGEPAARDQLVALVYDELRTLARKQRRQIGGSETVNTTALVHEVYEKLAGRDAGWNDRQHFFRIAARAMRDVLVDYARTQSALKRGGPGRDLPLDEARLIPDARTDEVLALDESLDRLAQRDPRRAEVVELRYFVGLTIAETADVLGASPATVKRDWIAARAWLHRDIMREPPGAA